MQTAYVCFVPYADIAAKADNQGSTVKEVVRIYRTSPCRPDFQDRADSRERMTSSPLNADARVLVCLETAPC